MSKGIVIFFVTVGSAIGGYAPSLIGNSNFLLSMLTGTIGGIAGIWAAWKYNNYLED